MRVVITDLDGTLLDRETYSYEAALPALRKLSRLGVPIVFCTSKTRAETEQWRSRLSNSHPFVVENGGAACIPHGYFPLPEPGSVPRDDYDVVEFGDPYAGLVAALERASKASRCLVRGFHELNTREVAALCNLPEAEAGLARLREYDEPFEVLDSTRLPQLVEAIRQQGKRHTTGGRFHHITGANDKARAAELLISLYRQHYGTVISIGLGDGLNDVSFLRKVEYPVLIRSPHSDAMSQAIPHGRITSAPGPEGWNEAILQMVPD